MQMSHARNHVNQGSAVPKKHRFQRASHFGVKAALAVANRDLTVKIFRHGRELPDRQIRTTRKKVRRPLVRTLRGAHRQGSPRHKREGIPRTVTERSEDRAPVLAQASRSTNSIEFIAKYSCVMLR
jgi:hypothetical protein